MDIRPMNLTDLGLVLAIQQRCYPPAYHEPLTAFENKLRQAPHSAWLATCAQGPQAYLVTLPVDEAHFPALHADNWHPPTQAKWLYLHDLAVDPDHRGSGAGQRLVEQAFTHARLLGLEGLALVAVQGSQPYWARQGFQARDVAHAGLREKLRSFGDEACFMVRD
ncbi:MAG: hypothetical protein A2711_03140 [Burkholderiales bacterium RIFCSPHIGHO2_01_FULL_63_240]|jgi:GNAT superfamily N-acetyltransferase|nr:MAG: hypothetical protein A2711_03140 [Burkholderiales bacterium RIFCSPHIGHO2_01_FULL_63_240]